MADLQIHENDEGVSFNFTVQDENGDAVDLSDFFDEGADTAEVRFRKPDGSTTVDKDLTAIDAASGTCKYISEAGVLTPAGTWRAQLHFIGDSESKEYRTSWALFVVHPNL